jgi:uncharacterized protein (DUF302 family)
MPDQKDDRMNLKLTGMQWIILGALLFSSVVQAETDGLESQVSAKDYAQTVVTLRKTLNGTGAKIFQEIDHRNNAVSMNVDLPPSRVFIFGNPKVGSHLMKCAPLVAVDLPMRMLVRKDSDGQTRLYWTKATTLMARYSSNLSSECQTLAQKVDNTLAELARQAGAEE